MSALPLFNRDFHATGLQLLDDIASPPFPDHDDFRGELGDTSEPVARNGPNASSRTTLIRFAAAIRTPRYNWCIIK